MSSRGKSSPLTPGLAVDALAAVLSCDAKDSDKLRAAVVILDRVGIGPRSSQDVSLSPSLVEQWAAELDASEPEALPPGE